MRNRLSFSVAALPGLVLVGCMASQDMRNDAKQAAVTGSVAYRELIALPPDAVLEVRLSDVSRQDVAAVITQGNPTRVNLMLERVIAGPKK